MKTIVLTLEMELFFGSDSGTVENSIVRPVRRLLELLDKHQMKFTAFWDVMHYVRLCQLAPTVPDLALDKEIIETEIKNLLAQGHDIQLHLHPHWLDATWNGSKWVFDYSRYTVQDLDPKMDPSDPNTICGCISLARKTLEKICRETHHSYKVSAFRAGSNSAIPFEALGIALSENQIFIDSSTAKGLERTKSFAPIDYKLMPDIQYYPFHQTPLEFDSNGTFWEFPIETIPVSVFRRQYFKFLNKMKYIDSGKYGDGKGLGETYHKPKQPIANWLKDCYIKFTPEESFPDEWEYMLDKARDLSLVVMQPKNMGPLAFSMLEKSIESGNVKFVSLKQRVSDLGIPY